ncbi:MAG: DMT family transporter [Spirochaetaceae bacterium]|jgi:drug/metabolite transporter (DMT)-like permease|nr:DMT family transporter [Spirochaetaceae bacterium]
MKQQAGFHQPVRRVGQGAILLCAVLWSTSGLFIKLIDWHPILIAGSRSLVAVLVLGIVRIVCRRRRRGVRGKFRYVLAGGIAYATTMISFVTANKLTASANAILLQYSAPVWAALLGWFFIREKPHWEHWAALLMVMGGLLLFFKDGLAGGSILGDGLALFSGIAFGANSVFLRIQKEGNPADSMFLAQLFTGAFSIPFFFIYPPCINPANVGCILFMGVFQIGAASLLFAYGIKRVPAVQAMLTAAIEPILNPIWVLLVTGEKPSLSAILGGGIIIAAVVLSSCIGKRRELRLNTVP